MLTEILLAAIGLLVIAFKVIKDDNTAIRAQLEQLKFKIDLQPLNDAIKQADKEVEDAKKNYDSSLDGTKPPSQS